MDDLKLPDENHLVDIVCDLSKGAEEYCCLCWIYQNWLNLLHYSSEYISGSSLSESSWPSDMEINSWIATWRSCDWPKYLPAIINAITEDDILLCHEAFRSTGYFASGLRMRREYPSKGRCERHSFSQRQQMLSSYRLWIGQILLTEDQAHSVYLLWPRENSVSVTDYGLKTVDWVPVGVTSFIAFLRTNFSIHRAVLVLGFVLLFLFSASWSVSCRITNWSDLLNSQNPRNFWDFRCRKEFFVSICIFCWCSCLRADILMALWMRGSDPGCSVSAAIVMLRVAMRQSVQKNACTRTWREWSLGAAPE